MADLITLPNHAYPPAPAVAVTLADAADAFEANAKSRQTQRCYRSDWSDFAGWCAALDLDPLPADPETVAQYLSACAWRGLSAEHDWPQGRRDRRQAPVEPSAAADHLRAGEGSHGGHPPPDWHQTQPQSPDHG